MITYKCYVHKIITCTYSFGLIGVLASLVETSFRERLRSWRAIAKMTRCCKFDKMLQRWRGETVKKYFTCQSFPQMPCLCTSSVQTQQEGATWVYCRFQSGLQIDMSGQMTNALQSSYGLLLRMFKRIQIIQCWDMLNFRKYLSSYLLYEHLMHSSKTDSFKIKTPPITMQLRLSLLIASFFY